MKSYLDQAYADKRMKSGTRLLIAAVVDRALKDAVGIAGHNEPPPSVFDTISAMAFLNSEECRDICIEINADYKTLKKEAVATSLHKIESKFTNKFFSGRA